MRKALIASVALGLCLTFGGAAKADKKQMAGDAVSKHMIAEATLTAHFIAAALLSGAKKIVVQGFQPRKLDAAPFRYVGVAGVDKPRIVQVGVAGEK